MKRKNEIKKIKIIRVDKQSGERSEEEETNEVLNRLKGCYNDVDKILEEFFNSKEEELRLQTMFAIYVIKKEGGESGKRATA